MADERVKANAEVESVALRCARVFRHKRLYPTLPPVLNLPFILWWAVRTGYAFVKEKRSQHEARTVAAFLANAEFQSDKVLQFFHGKYSVCLVGRDANIIATDYFHSKVGVNYVKHGGTNLAYLSISKNLASEVKSDARKKKRRVDEYHRDGKGGWINKEASKEAVRGSEMSAPISPVRRTRAWRFSAKSVSGSSEEDSSFRGRPAQAKALLGAKPSKDTSTHGRPHGVLLPSVERESKQYVEKFLEEEKVRQEHAVESLAQQSLDKIGKLEADGQLRREHEKAVDDQFMKLNVKLDKLEQELEQFVKMAGKGQGEAEVKTDAGAKAKEAPADNGKAKEEKEEDVEAAEAVAALVAEESEEEKEEALGKLAAALVRRVMTNAEVKLAQ